MTRQSRTRLHQALGAQNLMRSPLLLGTSKSNMYLRVLVVQGILSCGICEGNVRWSPSRTVVVQARLQVRVELVVEWPLVAGVV